jgi:hypothetical protein
MTDTMIFQNIDLSSWDILYIVICFLYGCEPRYLGLKGKNRLAA